MQQMGWEVGLDRQTFRQEFLVEVFSRLLAHEHASTTFILRWSTSTAHHLKNVHYGIINVAMFLAFVVLNSHNDHHVTRDRQAPCSVLKKNR